jgi:ribosomal protein L27
LSDRPEVTSRWIGFSENDGRWIAEGAIIRRQSRGARIVKKMS